MVVAGRVSPERADLEREDRPPRRQQLRDRSFAPRPHRHRFDRRSAPGRRGETMNCTQSVKAAGRARRARAGFSLMEVLMATSMLLASVIVLGELAGIGRRNASAARELATAEILCE